MVPVRIPSGFAAFTPVLLPWINRALEFLWLTAAILVPLAFIDRNYATSEAVIAYVEVPKIALLRTVAGLMAILWLLEWSISRTGSQDPTFTWSLTTLRNLPLRSVSTKWLSGQPTRWLFLAAWLFLGSTLVSTIFSGSPSAAGLCSLV